MNNNHHHHPHLHHSHQASLGSREVSCRAAGAAGAAVARGGVAAFTWRRGAEILIFHLKRCENPLKIWENIGKEWNVWEISTVCQMFFGQVGFPEGRCLGNVWK